MEWVQVELVRKGEIQDLKKNDPLAKQYIALAGSVVLLCKEPNIDQIIIEYLEEQDLIKKSPSNPVSEQYEKDSDIPYQAAHEVLMHAIVHIIGQDDIQSIVDDRDMLFGVVTMIREIFEEELKNPEEIAKRRSLCAQDIPPPFKPSMDTKDP